MSKYYIASTRKGRLLKIVEDVKVPISDKLQKLGRKTEDYLVRQRLVARFVNEDECQQWFNAYNAIHDTVTFPDAHYVCPKCGGSRIKCIVEATAVMEDRKVSLQNTWVEEIVDIRRCTCMNCGHHGFLCQWEVKDVNDR